MAIKRCRRERVYHVWDILGRNFVSGLRTLKRKEPKNCSLKAYVFQPWSCTHVYTLTDISSVAGACRVYHFTFTRARPVTPLMTLGRRMARKWGQRSTYQDWDVMTNSVQEHMTIVLASMTANALPPCRVCRTYTVPQKCTRLYNAKAGMRKLWKTDR